MMTMIEGDLSKMNPEIKQIKVKQENLAVEDNEIPESLKKTLDSIAAKVADRKDEVVNVLSNEQPAKSRMVEDSYIQCTWWEGCYYCQDENKNWHRVKCFA
jgi:hypothetical protein